MKLYISPPYFQNNHIVAYKTGRVQITTAWGSGPQKAKIDRISSEDRKKWPSAQVPYKYHHHLVAILRVDLWLDPFYSW